MGNISNWIARHIAILVLGAAIVALICPTWFSFLKTSYINPMLGVVMFGMGLTLNPHDFKVVFTHPREVLIGCLAQFTIMPLIAYLLTIIFRIPTDLAIGVILVGCCPGGTASNVMTYLAKGDLALSVGMTGVSTLLAPVLTPFITYMLAESDIEVNTLSMFLSIVQVVIVPIALGFLSNHYLSRVTKLVVPYLPMVSTIAITLIVVAIVSANSAKLLIGGWLILLVVALHNTCGLALGYIIGRLMRLTHAKCVAISIEVGMQNSGLASSLANLHFAAFPLATIPGAIFSVWHNVSGACVARLYAKDNDEK